jgi:type II secretory pathway pseudopilin PulG
LVVLAVIGILAGMMLPVLSRARERARVTRVQVELRQIELALESYHDDHGAYPPVRVSCNTDDRDHWCQLPAELVKEAYLPSGKRNGMSSAMEDPFNPGRTYKYAAIGPYLLNGALQRDGFAMFIPSDFPDCRSEEGSYHDDPSAPVAWAAWSIGPRPSVDRAFHPRAPVSPMTWYEGSGSQGVIARIKPRKGSSFPTQ